MGRWCSTWSQARQAWIICLCNVSVSLWLFSVAMLMSACSVGDGVYLFSQMESVYWIARRYDIPFLLIVLNNGGWNAPKVSALLVHKDGLSSKANRRGKLSKMQQVVYED